MLPGFTANGSLNKTTEKCEGYDLSFKTVEIDGIIPQLIGNCYTYIPCHRTPFGGKLKTVCCYSRISPIPFCHTFGC